MYTKPQIFLTIALAISSFMPGFLPEASAVVVLDETFADGSRGPTGNQNPPSSVNWYSFGESSTLTATTGAMTSVNGAGIAYFTDIGDQIVVGDGQTLEVTITLTPTITSTITGADIRFGLFNSGGSRVSSDDEGNSPAGVYTDYRGYTGTVGTRLELYGRTTSSDSLMNSISSGGYTRLKVGANLSLVSGTEYTYTLTLQNISGVMTITASLTGGDLEGRIITYEDSEYAYDTFDTIALYGSSNIDELEYTSIGVSLIPEPESSSLCFGGLVLAIAFMMAIRRRNAND